MIGQKGFCLPSLLRYIQHPTGAFLPAGFFSLPRPLIYSTIDCISTEFFFRALPFKAFLMQVFTVASRSFFKPAFSNPVPSLWQSLHDFPFVPSFVSLNNTLPLSTVASCCIAKTTVTIVHAAKTATALMPIVLMPIPPLTFSRCSVSYDTTRGFPCQAKTNSGRKR